MIIWFLLLSSLLFGAIDFSVYRLRLRKKAGKCLRRWFIVTVVLAYGLPILLFLLQRFLPDDLSWSMGLAQWIIFAFMLLQFGRLAYYLGLAVDHRRRWSRVGAILALGVAGALVWGATYGRQALTVNEIEVESARLPGAFDGMRVVQFSDLHIGALVNPGREIPRLIEKINALKPDLVVFTGDLVNTRYSELTPEYQAILNRIEAPYGVISVIGNHDVGRYVRDTVALPPRENTRLLVERQRAMGWRVLQNETVWLRRGSDSIAVSGIGFDPSLHSFRHSGNIEMNVEAPYRDVPAEAYNLTLAHLPQLWDNIVATGGAELTLSGHVHSMQIKVLGWSPAAWMYDRWSGRYDDERGNTLYINDGIGYVGYPMRLGAYPEITLFTLRQSRLCK